MDERWNQYKADFLRPIEGSVSYGTTSGCIPNPGKRFFFKITAQAVRDVNLMRDEKGLTYDRKAMIRCGSDNQRNGLWEIHQLFSHLQNIVSNYRSYFDGANPDEEYA